MLFLEDLTWSAEPYSKAGSDMDSNSSVCKFSSCSTSLVVYYVIWGGKIWRKEKEENVKERKNTKDKGENWN